MFKINLRLKKTELEPILSILIKIAIGKDSDEAPVASFKMSTLLKRVEKIFLKSMDSVFSARKSI